MCCLILEMEVKESEIDKEEPEAELLQRDDSWRQTAPVREWDKGKKGE